MTNGEQCHDHVEAEGRVSGQGYGGHLLWFQIGIWKTQAELIHQLLADYGSAAAKSQLAGIIFPGECLIAQRHARGYLP